jgi:hypothetical protein
MPRTHAHGCGLVPYRFVFIVDVNEDLPQMDSRPILKIEIKIGDAIASF